MTSRLLLLAALLAAGDKAPPRSIHVDLRDFLDGDEPSVSIQVISVDASLGRELTPESFDARVEEKGPDYTIVVHDLGKARALARRVAAVDLEQTGEEEKADVRYRIEFRDGEDEVKTIYVSIFGDIVDDGRHLEPTLDRGWLTAFWKDIEKHFVAPAR